MATPEQAAEGSGGDGGEGGPYNEGAEGGEGGACESFTSRHNHLLVAAARCQAHGEKIKHLEIKSSTALEELEECKLNLLASEQRVLELNKTLESTKSEMDAIQETFNIHKSSAENFRLQRDSAVEVRDSMSNMIETRNTEIDCLKRTIENLHAQLEVAVNVKCDVLSKNNSIQSKSLSSNYRDQYSEQEKVAHDSQIEVLKNELQRCMTDLHSVKGISTSMKINFERQLDRKNDELNVANAKIQKLCEIKDNLNKKVELSAKKLSEQQEREEKINEQLNKELVTRTRVAEMYKSLQDESNAKNEQCSHTISELRRLLNESTEKYEELEENLKKIKSEHTEEIAKKNGSIEALKRELENANDLLQYTDTDTLNTTMEGLSPSASIASKLIRSRMSLTQAYDQLVQISEELTIEKKENKRLSHALNTIVGELEEKAPLIDLQRMQHEEAMESNATLTKQLDDMILDNNKIKDENLELQKISSLLQKDKIKLKDENNDLSHQVCTLLKEIEVKRGRFFNSNKSNVSGFSSFIANDSIDMNCTDNSQKDLISFTDITELQANNQKLLRLIRDLSEKKDETVNNQSETEDIQSDLKQLQGRVSDLTAAQDRQVKMINKLVEQRDMYMKMSQNNSKTQGSATLNNTDLNTTSKSDVSKNSGNNHQYLELIEVQLTDTKKELHYEREKHRLYVEKSKNSELKLMETNGSLHKQYTDLQSKYAKSLSSSEVVNEKLKLLNMDLATYKREIAMLNNKINSYTSLTGKQESSIKIFYEDLSHSRARLSEAELLINNLQTEQSRRSNDSSNDRSSSIDRSSALKNIESIKNTIQEESNDGILKLESALEDANRTCSTLRCMLHEEQEKYHSLALHLKQEIDQSKLIIDEEKSQNQELKLNIENVQKELDSKCAIIEELNNKYNNVLYSDKEETVNIGNIHESNEFKSQIVILQQQLDISKHHIEKYCQIYECSEKELKSLNEIYLDYKQKAESTIEILQNSEKQHKEKCTLIENELALKSEELTSSQNKYNSLSLEFNERGSLLEKALFDVAHITETAQGVEEKYGLEIILHSNDIQSLGDLKDQLLQTKQYANDMMRAKLEAESSLQVNKTNWENTEKMLISENEEIKVQIKDLRNQNSLLHDQIQALSTKLTLSHSSQGIENTSDLNVADISNSSILNESDAVSSEQLLDIIKYLRKEKDVLITKFDITQAENLRLRSQLETIETRLDEAKLISGSVDKTILDVGSDTVKHAGIVRKIETLNAISDCYVNLYKERDNLLLRIEELSTSCNNLQESINPLQEKNAELSMNANLAQSENSDLKKEISKWKNRVNTLIGRDNQPFPEDWKKNQNERESLGKMLLNEKDNVKKISDEAAKLKSDNLMLEEQIDKLRKQYTNISETFKKRIAELNSSKKDNETLNKELIQTKAIVEEKNKEIAAVGEKLTLNETSLTEVRNKELQVRKVAKKFKDQCEELAKKVEAEKQKSALLVSEAATTSETIIETRKDHEQKVLELEKTQTERINQLNIQIATYEEENKKLLSEIESLRVVNRDTEEKAKQLAKQAKTKVVSLTELKENLMKELSETQTKLNLLEQNRDEHDVRLVAMKSQFDGRVGKLEKEKSQILIDKQGEITQLNRQIELLQSRISLMQRKVDSNLSPKPSTSSNQSEKTGNEPPTANIKPMAGVASPRDVNRRVSGDTPFASIRPMASHSGVRYTAAVLPTTAQLTTHTIVHHQTPHTTGVSADMTSSSPSSSHHLTEYLPTSSSPTARLHPSHSRHVTLPPPESTQDMDTDNVTCESDQSIGVIIPFTPPQSSATGQVGPQQGVALVMPRIEIAVENQNLHTHQQQASSSSNNNSSSTVTTTHAQNISSGLVGKSDPRTFKRPRMTSARPPQKTILKRPKIQRITESESEYQVPTSSQRDQEDDNNFGDSDDEEYQDRMCDVEEDEMEEKERLEREEQITDENNITGDREASGSNEAEVTNNLSQDIRNRAEDGNSSRSNAETHSGDHGTVPTMLSTSVQEQQIETISSGNGIDNSFILIGGASVSGVTSAGVSGNYEDGDDSIVPSTPTLYVPTRNDGFGEAVRSPMTVRGQSTNEGRFTFNESTANATGGTMEDTHADLAPQLTPHNHASPEEGNVSGDAAVAILVSSEAESGVNASRNINTEEELPTVSSQGNPSNFSSQVEEGREAEASSTGGFNTPPHELRRGMRGIKSNNRGNAHVHTPRPSEHQRVVWGSDGNFRRGNSYSSHRASSRGGRHAARRPPTFFKRF